jgi:hypothetical protein
VKRILGLLVLMVGTWAHAQGNDLAARVDRLAEQVAELEKIAAGVPSVQQAVADLTTQVAALRQEVARGAREEEAEAAERAKIDRMEPKLAELEARVTAVAERTRAATVVQAPAAVMIGTPDGSASAWLHAYAQLRFEGRMNQAADTLVDDGFRLRRARVALDGHVISPRVTYGVEVDLANGVQLLDWWAEGRIGRYLRVRAGQFKVPFSREEMLDDGQLTFLERPLATEEFAYDRDLGAQVSVRTARSELRVGVFNGAGPNKVNDNLDLLFAAVAWHTVLGSPRWREEPDFDRNPYPSLALGVGFSFEDTPVPDQVGYLSVDPVVRAVTVDTDGDGRRDNVRVLQVALMLAARWKGIDLQSETYIRREDWGTFGRAQAMPFDPQSTYVGSFVQASAFLIPGRLQLGVRGSIAQISPLTLGGRVRDVPVPVSDLRDEFSAIISYYRKRHDVRLGLQYSVFDWGARSQDAPSGVAEHRGILEAQVGF